MVIIHVIMVNSLDGCYHLIYVYEPHVLIYVYERHVLIYVYERHVLHDSNIIGFNVFLYIIQELISKRVAVLYLRLYIVRLRQVVLLLGRRLLGMLLGV